MPGRGNRQEFRDSFDDTEDGCVNESHTFFVIAPARLWGGVFAHGNPAIDLISKQ
jgi:hypothetical protein